MTLCVSFEISPLATRWRCVASLHVDLFEKIWSWKQNQPPWLFVYVWLSILNYTIRVIQQLVLTNLCRSQHDFVIAPFGEPLTTSAASAPRYSHTPPSASCSSNILLARSFVSLRSASSASWVSPSSAKSVAKERLVVVNMINKYNKQAKS